MNSTRIPFNTNTDMPIPAAPMPGKRHVVQIATHSDSFHADDVLGVAVLQGCIPQDKEETLGFSTFSLKRSRDPEVWAASNFVVDVGGVFDPEAGRFDHHQKGFNLSRENGTGRYAAAGLVWAQYGATFVKRVKPDLRDSEVMEIVELLDYQLIQYVDKADTGEAHSAQGHYGLSAIIAGFNPTTEELDEHADPEGYYHQPPGAVRMNSFKRAVIVVDQILRREVVQAASAIRGREKVRSAETVADGKILILTEPGLDWEAVVCPTMPDVQFVVYPEGEGERYRLRTVPAKLGSFTSRKMLPANWAGLNGPELDAQVGLQGTIFCHNGRFIAGGGSKENTLRMAHMAIEASVQTSAADNKH